MTRQCTTWVALLLATVVLASAVGAPDAVPRRRRGDGKNTEALREARRTNTMIDNGVELLEAGQTERAVKVLSQVPRMFPNAKARFRAYLVLGRHLAEKRQFEEAIEQFKQVAASPLEAERAEGLYRTGVGYFEMNDVDQALVSLRRVTQEFRWSVFANEAYYYIGLCHFQQKRWAKANEALKMVGLSVPAEADVDRYVEAGQRLYIKIHDKDLDVLTKLGRPAQVVVETTFGDRESIAVEALARHAADFIGSLPTEPGVAKPGDGILQVKGGDAAEVAYIDENTRSGELNKRRLARVVMASTATVGFTDGAYRQYVNGVFGDQPAFIRVRDLDLNTSDQADSLAVKLVSRHKVEREEDASRRGVELEDVVEWETRDAVDLTLTESGPQTGVFTGQLWPVVDATDAEAPANVVSIRVREDDQVVLEYTDRRTIDGDEAVIRTVAVPVVIGRVPNVQSIEYKTTDLQLQARKRILEARIFLKWAQIFKDVGLLNKATEKAAEGLERVEEVIRISTRINLDRELIEDSFQAKWELLLVQDKLSAAIGVCQALTRLFPDSRLADQAFLKIGQANLENDLPKDSLPLFRAVLRLSAADVDVKAEAQYLIGVALEKIATDAAVDGARPNLTSAISAYKATAETYPDSHFAGEALQKIVNYYLLFKDYARAGEMVDRVVRDYPDKPWLDEIILKGGIAAYRMKNYGLARAKFQQIVEEYPGGKVADKAKKFIAKMGDRS